MLRNTTNNVGGNPSHHCGAQSHRAEPIEETADSVLTQQSLSETQESHHSQIAPPDTQSHIGYDLATPLSPPEVTQAEFNPFLALLEDPDFDTMAYPYPHYMDDLDAESHIHSFVSTWQANHST